MKGHLENAKRKKVLTSFFYLPFQQKLSALFWIVQFTLLAVFQEEQWKGLRHAEVTVLLEDVGKVEVWDWTQSELRDTVEEVGCETFYGTKSGFKHWRSGFWNLSRDKEHLQASFKFCKCNKAIFWTTFG